MIFRCTCLAILDYRIRYPAGIDKLCTYNNSIRGESHSTMSISMSSPAVKLASLEPDRVYSVYEEDCVVFHSSS